MVPEIVNYVRMRASGLASLGLPTEKELRSASRKKAAAGLRLEKLSAPWKRELQLEKLRAVGRESGEEFSFAVLGDAEPGRFWIFRKLFNKKGVFETQLRRVQSRPVDFSMQMGDMVSRGIKRNYLQFFRRLDHVGVRVPYLTTLGNHDRRFPHGRCDADLYRSFFGRTNYHFDHGGVRFVSLDSSLIRLTRWQLSWLDRILDFPGRKIVFTHIPPVGLREWTKIAWRREVAGFKVGADEMMEIFSARAVDRVYLGHVHAFGVQEYKGVRYVLSGGGGSPLYPVGQSNVFHHTLAVCIGPDGIRETLHPLHGRPIPVSEAANLIV
ncbi:MAG: hypothetical protein COB53_12900 [Elusimicrobia bacterium]|nr:MAG: hypothetical protein COB53_12900 [Elusimicrobiota bacterium]